MDRRKFIAVGATALIAGCDGDGNDGTDTPGDDGTDTPGENGDGTGTPGASTGTPTEESTVTPGGSFDASVSFESCTEFTVEAEEFSSVWAALAGGDVEQWQEGYSGSESFEASGPINSVTVYGTGENDVYEAPNPDASECREGS